MLISLHVKNLALIEEAEVEFGPGLNILTGETGAGKSILIGSVNLALGAKAEKEFIRSGADFGLVELVFQTKDSGILKRMREMELPEEEGNIVISRKVQPGRSISKINGEIVTARQIKELAEMLIDIHGQHEHQSLLYKNKHLEILDDFAGEKLKRIAASYTNAYEKWQTLKKQIQNESVDEETRNREIDFLNFEIQEIDAAEIKPGEDEQLESIYRKLVNSRKIVQAVSGAYQLTGYENENSAGSQIGRALREIKSVVQYDTNLEELEGQITELDGLLNDFNRSLSDYMKDADGGQYDFAEIEGRLNLLNRLKDKYGNSLEEVLNYQENAQRKLDKLMDFEQYMKELENQCQASAQKVKELGTEMTQIRKAYAKKLEQQLTKALEELNFLAVTFQVCITAKQEPGNNGFDDVEFLISTNPGETLKPLKQVASGGELSRIMLAIKTVLTQKDNIDTVIFDEIDAGISGKTAWKVSEKLRTLSERQQVICITHLPQIAAMADTHFKIEKSSDGANTSTQIAVLQSEEMITELARLLGSDMITEAAMENARELKKMTGKTYQ